MLGNKVCDSSCNTLECFFDKGDCVCNIGCRFQDFPACPQACLNYKCGYAYFGHESGCNDAAALKKAMSQQALNSNYFATFDQAACFASDATCSSEKLGSYAESKECESCSDEPCAYPCDTHQCAFTFGNCYSTLHISCARGFGPTRQQCYECKPGYFLVYSTCVKYCPLGFEVNSVVPRMCTPLNDPSSKEKPGIMYATSSRIDGDGSLEHPFGTLGLALSAFWTNYTVIYLIGPKVDFTINFASENPEFATISNLYDPLSSLRFQELTIKSLRCSSLWSPYCSNNSTVIQGFAQMIYFNVSSNVTFEDVIFSSADIFEGFSYSFCPFITFNQLVKVPAKLQANSDLCRKFSGYSIIVVRPGGWLWLKNMNVQNLAMQMLSFINIEGGNVKLDNVNFTSVQASTRESYAAVILQQSPCSPGFCGSLRYQKGVITLLNNGYEYADELYLVPFLRAKAVDTLELTELDFKLNMVVDASVGAYGSSKALLYVGNCMILNISKSNFTGNIATGGVIFVDSDIDLPNKGTSPSDALLYSNYRLIFKDLYFAYNYADEGIIYVSFGGFTGSVEITNCEFWFSATVSESLITLFNLGEPLATVAAGQIIETTSAVIQRRNLTISNVKFSNNASYMSLVAIKALGNGKITDVVMERNGSLKNNTSTFVFSYYVNFTATAAIKIPLVNKPLPCTCSISLTNCANFLVRNVVFNYNLCEAGGAGLDVVKIQGQLSISYLSGIQNVGSSLKGGILLTLAGVEAAVSHLVIRQNTNIAGAMMAITDLSNVTVDQAEFTSNSGSSGTCILVFAGGKVTLSSVFALFNSAQSSNGGVLYWQGTGNEPVAALSVDDCFFQGNSADIGGVLYLSALSKSALQVTVTNTYFTKNKGFVSASAIYVGLLIEIKQNSTMFNSIFDSNSSPIGAVYLMHYKGNFTLVSSTFYKNKGKEAAGMAVETNVEALVMMIDVYFALHTQGPTFLVANPRAFTSIISRNMTFRNNQLTDIIMEGGYWEDRYSVYNGSTVAEVVLSTSAIFNVSDASFLHNFDPSGGSAVRVQTNSTFLCVRCNFLQNSAGRNGGALTVEQNGVILLSDCLFQENSAKENAAALYVMAALDRNSVIRNSRFLRNKSGGFGTIFVTAALLVMENITLQENVGVQTPGIVLLMGSLLLTDISFSSQAGELAAFLILFTYSNATIQNSRFDNGFSTQGAAVLISTSNLTVSNSLFRDIEGTLAGAIYAVSGSQLTLQQVTMTQISSAVPGSLVYLHTSSLSAVDCTFQNFTLTGIVGFTVPQVTVLTSSFESGPAGAIYCGQCLQVHISHSSFSRLNALQGAALDLQNTAEGQDCHAVITNLTCRYNQASDGGALSVLNYNLSLIGGLFEHNTADTGGAVYFACDFARNCSYLVSESQFVSNTAYVKGGAIAWSNAKPVIVSPIFSDNTAIYGDNVASFPIKLTLDSVEPKSKSRVLANYDFAGVFANFVSGQDVPFMLKLTLRDHLNQVVTTDSTSSASIEIDKPDNSLIAGMSKVMASSGTFIFSSFTIFAKPGSSITLSFSTDAVLQKHQSDPDTHIAIEKTLILLRPCIAGEYEYATGCQVCTKGTFSFNPSDSCQSCPPNAICEGQVYMYPVPGYWRSSNVSAELRPCRNSGSCLGGEREGQVPNLQGDCAEGYKGNLCQSCAENYSRTGPNRCSLCPENDVNVVRLTFVAVAIIILLSVMVWTTLRSSMGPKAIHSILIKILVNYLQLVLIVTQFKLNWPGPVDDLFSAQQEAGGATAQAYSFECFLQNGSGENPFFSKLIFMAVLPLPLALIVGVVWLCIALNRHKMIYLQRECTATMVILYFLILPDLVKAFFSLLSCDEIEKGDYWLVADLDIRCWDSSHSLYALALGVPAIVIWVFAVPLLCLLLLVRNRRQQDELWFKMRYGFLTNGYTRMRYYWEFVVLYRKILIIICSVFLSDNVAMQALTVDLVLLFFLTLQYEIKPYTTKQLNHIELIGILVANITIYCGLYFLTDNLSTQSSWFFFVVIVAINAAFFLYWIWALISYALNKFLSHLLLFQSIFHLAEKLDPDIEAFLAMHTCKESCADFGDNLQWAYRQMTARGSDLFIGPRKLKSLGRQGNRVEWHRPPSISATHMSRLAAPSIAI